jgi:hypothetical protein
LIESHCRNQILYFYIQIVWSGGRKLQAHLNALYENGYWREVVDVLQALLFQLSLASQNPLQADFPSKTTAPSTPTVSRARSTHSMGRAATAGKDREVAAATWYDTVLDEKLSDKVRDELTVRFDVEEIGAKSVTNATSSPNRSASRGASRGASRSRSPGEFALDELQESFSLTPTLSIEELGTLWRQLILTTVAIGLRCVEAQRFDEAMGFLQQAEQFDKNENLLTRESRRECSAHIKGTEQ